MEDLRKRERFIDEAETRTNKVIDAIRKLGECSDKRDYAYTEEELEKVFAAIEVELIIARAKFLDIDLTKRRFKF